MAHPLSGLEPASWQVTLLPNPPRFARSRALGFCGLVPGVAPRRRGRR